jgi:LemA protein
VRDLIFLRPRTFVRFEPLRTWGRVPLQLQNAEHGQTVGDVLLLLLSCLLPFAVYLVITYKRLISLRTDLVNSWSQVEVLLQRGCGLVDSLVPMVQGHAGGDHQRLVATVAACRSLGSTPTPAQAASAFTSMQTALFELADLEELYPDLLADPEFITARGQILQASTAVEETWTSYNETVLRYNSKIRTFPSNVIAMVAAFTPREMFDNPS